jgi:8-oxo-dGTP pyrophosphatase MutT (NUDIX family)
VLVPVFRDAAGELRLLLVVRAEHGAFGGQLGLPGGNAEPGDRTMLDTAVREAREEVGLTSDDIEVIAALAPMRTRTTGFEVFPYLARIPAQVHWQLQPAEIAGTLTPTVRSLAEPQRRRQRMMSFPSWPEPRMTDCIDVDGHPLWGFTLRLLDAVVPRLLSGAWQL